MAYNSEQAKEGFGDGLSKWTHTAARSTKPRSCARTLTLRERILQQEHAFRELKARTDRASDVERPTLQRRLAEKARWLETLWQSMAAEQKRDA